MWRAWLSSSTCHSLAGTHQDNRQHPGPLQWRSGCPAVHDKYPPWNSCCRRLRLIQRNRKGLEKYVCLQWWFNNLTSSCRLWVCEDKMEHESEIQRHPPVRVELWVTKCKCRQQRGEEGGGSSERICRVTGSYCYKLASAEPLGRFILLHTVCIFKKNFASLLEGQCDNCRACLPTKKQTRWGIYYSVCSHPTKNM